MKQGTTSNVELEAKEKLDFDSKSSPPRLPSLPLKSSKLPLDDEITLRDSLDQTRREQTWLGYLWDTADATAAERKLLFKLDAVLLTLASCGNFVKYLDQTNINNAFVSGMKEDLNMYSNELTTAQSLWTVGYVVGQLPVLLLLTRVSPRWIIPSFELGFAICTLAFFAVKDVKTVYALRFLVGLFEAGLFSSCQYVLASFYGTRELSKRACIFYTSGLIGSLFSGVVQAGTATGLDGVCGLAGWRWSFIVDALLSFIVCIAGYIFYPGLPWQKQKCFWLSEEELELCRARMRAAGRAEARPWTRQRVIKLFTTWEIWILSPFYALFYNATIVQPLPFWLKSFNEHPAPVPGRSYTISQINLLPLPATAIFVVVGYICAWTSDGPLKGCRWPLIFVGSFANIALNAAILKTPLYTAIKARTALYYLIPCATAFGVLMSPWINEICSDDAEKRAIVLATAGTLTWTIQAIAPNFLWKVTDMPRATKGHLYSLSLSAALIFWTLLVLYFVRRRNTTLVDVEELSAGVVDLKTKGGWEFDASGEVEGDEREEKKTA